MPGRIQSVERAAAILNLLASGSRRLGVVELAKFLDLPKGTVHGILATLAHIGFVEQDRITGKYQLGATLLHLGNSYLDVNELRTRAINWADSLASRSREAVQIGALHDGKVLIVHHVFRPDDSVQALQVGALLPAHATALGKVLVANDPGREPDTEDWAAVTERTIVEPAVLDSEFDRILAQGWAPEIEELVVGEAAIAAPIRDDRNLVVGAIGIRGAMERLCADQDTVRAELVAFVRDAARAVSRDLGAHRW
ncbi:MAG TPA: IclR family transcriptional regulator [Pseudolysinimonas sp.]|nr:IclR family transcriptional regulator [Pseudolysinimonas sp.]